MSELKRTLQRRFGLEAFRPGQRDAIETLLAGQDLLVVMPTGAGKSLIYQAASFHLPGLTLVISPLIALMQDQVTGLKARGIPATFINSTLSQGEQQIRLSNLRRNRYKIVYVAP